MQGTLGSIVLSVAFCCALSAPAAGKRPAAPAAKKRAAKTHTMAKKRPATLRGKRGGRRSQPLTPPPMPSRIEVLATEPASGGVQLALYGLSRPPETRLFVLTDERGRRFVPATAECTSEPEPTEATAKEPLAAKERAATRADSEESSSVPTRWLCDLTLAPLYRRAALTGVAMEWGDRSVSALPGQVAARWAEGPVTNHISPRPALPAAQPQPQLPVDKESPDTASSEEHGEEFDSD